MLSLDTTVLIPKTARQSAELEISYIVQNIPNTLRDPSRMTQ